MPTSVKQLTILLTVLFILNGDIRTLAEITLTFDIHGTGSNKTADTNTHPTSVSKNDTNVLEPVLIGNTPADAGSDVNNADTGNEISAADGVKKATDPLAPVNQSKDENRLSPVVVNERPVDIQNGIADNIPNVKEVPETAVSFIQEATKPVNQRKDSKHILPVITNSVETENVHVANESGEQRKSVSVISVREETVKHVTKDDNSLNPKPAMINESNRPSAEVTRENQTNERETPISVVSKSNSSAPVIQSKDTSDILPIVVGDPRLVNHTASVDGSDSPKTSVSRIQDTIGQLNQSKNANDVLPVFIGDPRNVNHTASVDGSDTPKSSVSRIQDTIGQVDQSKNASDVLPVFIGDPRNVNHTASVDGSDTPKSSVSRIQDTIGQVDQSKDASTDIKPVLTSITKVDVNNSTSIKNRKENRSITAEVSFVNSTKPINQSKDKAVISPVVINSINITNNVDINNGNVQEPVHQATDERVLKPVEANITSVKNEVDNSKDVQDFNKTFPTPPIVIGNKVQPMSDIPSVDIRKRYNSIGTEFCNEKNRCNSTIPSKSCFCDVMCGVLNDCCEDAETSKSLDIKPDQLSCSHVAGMSDYGDGFMLVSKCSPTWSDDVTRRLCESEADNNDIYSRIPVSNQTVEGIIYKNRYCAHCDNVFKYEFWKAEVTCSKNSSVIDVSAKGNCKLSFQMPNTTATFRTCERNLKIISTCKTSFIGDEIREKCVNDFYSITYSNEGDLYRNRYCAMCNDVRVENLYCQSQLFFSVERMEPKFVYSFRMIVDFNTKLEVQNEQIVPFHECNDNEIYDPFSKTCREIFCPPYTVPVQGTCDPVSQNIVGIMNNQTMFNTTANCTLTVIEENEFEMSNETNVITFRDIILNDTEYWKNGTDIFVCLEKLNISSTTDISKLRNLYPFSPVESYVSFIGLVLSITGSLLTLLVYVMFPKQLLNTPGKNVMCLIISLAVSQVLFLAASEVATLQNVCVTVAIMMHYFFLCSFCWMNIIAFDLWVTFSHKFVSVRHQSLNSRRFYYYSLYAWCLPLLIVGIADILNFIEFDGKSTNSFIPNYGNGVCWITSRNALLIFFAGPLAVFKVFDFICFGFTVYHITKARTQGTFARKGTSASAFIINLRLSIVMGLTWAFAFLANFTNNNVLWYFFIIFNTLQGLFIAISFLCTKKVLKLFRDNYGNGLSRSSETQMTTRPSYKSSE